MTEIAALERPDCAPQWASSANVASAAGTLPAASRRTTDQSIEPLR